MIGFAAGNTSSGSSPRVRGTDEWDHTYGIPVRFIPARAGNGAVVRNHDHRLAVHPRACGERRPQRDRAHL